MLILLNWKQTRTASFYFLMIRIFAKKIIDILFYLDFSSAIKQEMDRAFCSSVFFFIIICFAFV